MHLYFRVKWCSQCCPNETKIYFIRLILLRTSSIKLNQNLFNPERPDTNFMKSDIYAKKWKNSFLSIEIFWNCTYVSVKF